jgi:hypothetical protein
MALMVLSSSLLSSLSLFRSFCDHSVHRMRIGRALDAHRTRIGFKFGCASDTHSMRGAVYVPVDLALSRLV